MELFVSFTVATYLALALALALTAVYSEMF